MDDSEEKHKLQSDKREFMPYVDKNELLTHNFFLKNTVFLITHTS